MILTDIEIRKLVNEKNMITKFDEESLQSESYDLSIGNQISKYKPDFKIMDLSNQKDIDNAYEIINFPKEGYLLGPNEYILVSIKEKLNIPQNINAHIRPRTRYTRIGLLVSSQHCTSSYSGILNLGLLNANPFAVKIFSGMKIAQIVFEELTNIPSPEKQYHKHGIYQNESGTLGANFTDEITIEGTKDKIANDVKAIEFYQLLKEGLKKD